MTISNVKSFADLNDVQFSKCLNALYGPKDSFLAKLYGVTYASKDLASAELYGPAQEMNRIILKVQDLKLILHPIKGDVPDVKLENIEGSIRYIKLTITNKRALDIFKEAVYKAVNEDKNAWARFMKSHSKL